MQAGEKKKLVFLAALLAVLGLIWVYRSFTGGDAGKPGAAGASRRAAVVVPDAPVNVRMDLLDREKPELEVGRNIFDPAYKKPVVKPPTATQPGPEVVRQPAPPPPPPPPPDPKVVAAQKAEAEMSKFKFMGFLKRAGRTDVFLALDADYFVATRGETITKGYYLKDIGTDHLLFEDRDTGAQAKVKVNFDEGDKGAVVPVPGVAGGGTPPPASPAASQPPPRRNSPVERSRPGQARGLPASRGAAQSTGGGGTAFYQQQKEEGQGEGPEQAQAPTAIENRSVR